MANKANYPSLTDQIYPAIVNADDLYDHN